MANLTRSPHGAIARPFLKDQLFREEVHRYLGGILANLDCQPLIIGAAEDHVHLLFTHSRTAPVADVVKELKRGSSLWLETACSTVARCWDVGSHSPAPWGWV